MAQRSQLLKAIKLAVILPAASFALLAAFLASSGARAAGPSKIHWTKQEKPIGHKERPFARQFGVTYPVLLDADGKVNRLFEVEGIPKTFVYDRSGHLVTESIDMRTRQQFLAMLAEAGLQ